MNYIFCRLDENPFCLKPEAARICNNTQPLRSFIPLEDCAPLPCFSDPIFSSDCKRPYLGSLFFRSFSFSDLTNSLYYAFLTKSLQPRLEKLQIPIDRVCLVSSMIDLNGYLVLNISFLPLDGYSFNRTAVSTMNNYLNNHIYPSPYGPYYYSDLSYTNFPGKRDDALLRTSSVYSFSSLMTRLDETAGPGKNTGLIVGVSIAGSVLALLTIAAVVYGYRQRRIAQRAVKLNNPFGKISHQS